MKILAVDTTSVRIGLAFGDERSCVVRSVLARGAHDEKLFGEADRLLKKARCKLRDVDALAVASGPGSFTGIRVGMTFVSVLAESLGKPAAAVSLLEAEAARAWSTSDKDADGVVAVLPAAREEFFFQAFAPRGGELAPLAEPRWVPPAAWPKAYHTDARGRELALVGPAAADAARRLGPAKPVVWRTRPLSPADLIGPALAKIRAGWLELTPLYLKPAYYERNPPKLVR